MKYVSMFAPVFSRLLVVICFVVSLALLRNGQTLEAVYWVLVAIYYRLYIMNGEKHETK